MNSPTVTESRTGAVAWLTFSRPHAANAMNLEMAEATRDCVERLAADPTCTVLVLSGSARFFSAGGDVAEIFARTDSAAYLLELATTLHDAVEQLIASNLIVVAAVEGVAAGAGFALSLVADIVIAGESARFMTSYLGVGLTPDTGLSYLLPRVVGERRARGLTLLGTPIDAPTALEWGIVNEVVRDGAVLERATEVGVQLGSAAQPALTESKRLLNAGRSATLHDQLADEARTITAMLDSADAQQRLSRFSQKKSPSTKLGAKQ